MDGSVKFVSPAYNVCWVDLLPEFSATDWLTAWITTVTTAQMEVYGYTQMGTANIKWVWERYWGRQPAERSLFHLLEIILDFQVTNNIELY